MDLLSLNSAGFRFEYLRLWPRMRTHESSLHHLRPLLSPGPLLGTCPPRVCHLSSLWTHLALCVRLYLLKAALDWLLLFIHSNALDFCLEYLARLYLEEYSIWFMLSLLSFCFQCVPSIPCFFLLPYFGLSTFQWFVFSIWMASFCFMLVENDLFAVRYSSLRHIIPWVLCPLPPLWLRSVPFLSTQKVPLPLGNHALIHPTPINANLLSVTTVLMFLELRVSGIIQDLCVMSGFLHITYEVEIWLCCCGSLVTMVILFCFIAN